MSKQNITHKILHTKYILLIGLFLVAFLERTAFDLGANIELVTMALILSSLYLGRKEAFWLILVIMAVTDRVLGNTPILIFTWSGFLIPSFFVSSALKKLGTKGKKKYLSSLGTGFGTNLFFFFWTNFGFWLLDTWGMYPKTFPGLVMSYINGLPFLRNQLVSSLIFIPLGIFSVEAIRLLYKRYSSSSVKPYQKRATF
jgi:hypothetical protein